MAAVYKSRKACGHQKPGQGPGSDSRCGLTGGQPYGHLELGLQSPDCETKNWFQLPSVWCVVSTALGNKYKGVTEADEGVLGRRFRGEVEKHIHGRGKQSRVEGRWAGGDRGLLSAGHQVLCVLGLWTCHAQLLLACAHLPRPQLLAPPGPLLHLCTPPIL
jgi:hypothetical protein